MVRTGIFLLFVIGSFLLQEVTAQSDISKREDTSTSSFPRKELAIVNTSFAEARPLISKDGNTLYFSRRYHPDNIKGEKDFQDVWVSYRDSVTGKWSEPKNLGPVINNRKRNAIASLSPDGMDGIFFNTYRKTRRLPLVRSRRSGDSWTKPRVMNIENYVNVSDYADFSIDFENKVLILAVQADKSVGNQDLYISFLDPYGGWKEPINLGTVINTELPDFAPFIGPEGKFLFFCSYGHEGQGGSDIYLSVRLDDSWLRWSEPVNLGPSINTPFEETYFSITGDLKYLYYTSYNPEAKDRNILRVALPEGFLAAHGPLLAQLDSLGISGKMLSKNVQKEQQQPGEGERLTTALAETINLEKAVTDEISKVLKEQGQAASANPKAEQPSFVAEPAAGKLSAAAEEMKSYLQAALPDLTLEVRQKQDTVEFKIVQNLLYGFNSVYVTAKYLPRLSRLAHILRERPELKVQLIGHTDNVGDEAVNRRVAKKRVENLVSYFTDRNVSSNRIEILGAGKSDPLVSNATREGREQNRRVETIIRFIE